MAKLGISLFGQFQVLLNGAPVTQFESVKVRALLAYLAAEANRPQPREHLATLLWPDWPQQSAMSNLRYALADLRKVIGDRDAQPPFLLISRDSLQLNREADMWVDVGEFEAAINKQGTGDKGQGTQVSDLLASISNLKSAISLYRGPFLEGFSLPDSAPFEEWLLAKRENFSQQMLKALSQLAEWEIEQANYDLAEGYARRQIELEPWREQAYQQLMRALSLKGERVQALAQYENLRKALQRELKVEPSEETVELYQQIRDGKLGPHKEAVTTIEAPLLLSVERLHHNLPPELTSFIGREKEITAVCRLLADHRLVTLTGVGGVGKTRLSLAVAEQVLGEFEHGAWLAELAPLGEPQLVPQTVATVFGLRPDPNRPVLDTLLDYLRAKHLLLILDNCEHLIGACAALAETILRSCPRVHLIASSREALGVAGEIPYTVPSLALPDPRSLPPLHSLPEYEAVQLFLDRAQAAAPGFTINETNAAGLVRICQRVDGIPLALELAAARLQVLSIEQIATRLEADFRLLTGGSRRALPRHQTLQALIGWSYELLTDEEKDVFRRLSVFSGGWTLVAAEAVCSNSSAGASPASSAAGAVCERDVLDVLAQLVNKSLVVVMRQNGEVVRYRMLETIRQYAQERLTEAGEAPAVRDHHLDFYLMLAESSGNRLLTYEGLTGREKLACLERLRTELDNLRGALGWSLGGEPGLRAEKGLRMASALDYLWFIDGHAVEGRDWLEKGLAMLAMDRPQSLALRAKAVFAIGGIGMFYGDKDARKMFEESMALFQQVGDVFWYTIAEEALGNELKEVDQPLALSYLEDAIARFRQLGKTGLLAETLCIKGVLFVRIQDDEKGRTDIEAGVALFQELDDPVDAGFWQGYLGDIAIRRGDFDRARFHAEERLRWSSDRIGMGWALGGLGRIARLQKDYAQMESMFQKEYQISTDLGRKEEMQNCFWLMGVAALGQGDYRRAARIFVEFAPMARAVENRIGLLSCLTAWAGVALGLDQPARAAQTLATVDAGLAAEGEKLYPDDQLDYDRYLDACHAQLEAAAFESAWAQGRLLTLDQALDAAQAFCSQDTVENAKGV